MHLRTTRRGLTLIAIAASLVLLGGNLASADVELGDHGHFGPHMLGDTAATPGVTCVYVTHPNAFRLTQVRVKAPYVDPAGAGSQKVGWDFQLQQGPSTSGPWSVIATSARTTAIATAPSTAPLTPLSLAVSSVRSDHYRVIIGIYWYKHASVNGHSRHRLEYYKPGGSLLHKNYLVEGDCRGAFGRL